jgi:hypothetical protein
MKLINEFLNVLKEIRNDKLSYLFLFFQLVFFSGLVRQLCTDEALVANMAVTAFLCLKTKKITKREHNLFLGILGIFILINIIPSLMFGIAPKLFLGYSGRIFIGIFIVVYFKRSFFDVFEKLVFVLAFISLLLFLIQIIYEPIFDIFESFSNLVLTDERLFFGRYELSGHRYFLIFLVNSWSKYRNSGFMWEPAAFGAVLAWATLTNAFIYRFRMNPRMIVLFIAALTTFSIGTYIYFSIFTLIYLMKNFGNKSGLIFLFLNLILLPAFFQLQFVQDNVQMITDKIQKEQSMADKIRANVYAHKRVSRVGGFVGNIGQIIREPFGLGTRYEFGEYFLYETPNGLMILLRNWGIFSLIIIMACSYRLIKKLGTLYDFQVNLFYTALLMMIIILPIAGNSFYNQPFLIAILLSGFIVSKRYNDKSHAMQNHTKQPKKHQAYV